MQCVVVTDLDNESRDIFLRLSGDKEVGTVKRMWIEKFESQESQLKIFSNRQELLDDNVTLTDKRLSNSSSRVVELFVEDQLEFPVTIFGCKSEMRHLPLRLSETPEALLGRCREAFEIKDSRDIRLLINGVALNPKLPLRSQNVGLHLTLEVDLKLTIDVEDEIMKETDVLQAFWSDPASLLLKSPGDEERFIHENNFLDISGTLGSAVKQLGPRWEERHCIRRETKVLIGIVTGKAIKEHKVWSNSLVTEISEKSSGSSLTFEGTEVSSEDALSSSLIGPNSLLTTTDLSVSVKLSSGKLKVVRLPMIASVADLQSEIFKMEKTNLIDLFLDGVCLNDKFHCHSNIEICEGRCVEVVKRTSLSIQLLLENGEEISFETREATSSYSSLQKVVGPILGEDNEILFTCSGCGRRLTPEREFCQSVPAACCEIQSQTLQVTTEHRRDFGTQTRSQCQSVATSTTDLEPHSSDVSCQTTISTQDNQTQENNFFASRTVQARFIGPDDVLKSVTSMMMDPNQSVTDFVKTAAQLQGVRAEAGSEHFIYLRGIYIKNTSKHAVETSSGRFADEDDELHAMTEGSVFTQDILEYEYDLMFPPYQTPCLSVQLQTRFETWDRQKLPADAIMDKKYFARLVGRRVSDRKGENPSKLFMMTENHKFVDVDTDGSILGLESSIKRGTFSDADQEVEVVIFLLGTGSQIPPFKIPKYTHLYVFLREGVEVQLVDGVVHGWGEGSRTRWTRPRLTTDFQRKLTEFLNS